jgi:hypothetical protein
MDFTTFYYFVNFSEWAIHSIAVTKIRC